jgi:predicted MFS family arabinose efflux permease
MVTTYALSQMFGRIVFGKFLLPRVQIHKYIIISSVIFAVCMVAFMNLTSVYAVAGFMVLLGLADSCLYPALVGYGLDQLEHTSPQATSFMITIGSIGIPVGTAMSGLVGVQFGRMTSMAIGPVLLIVVAVLIYIVKKMSDGKDAKLAPVSSFAGTR